MPLDARDYPPGTPIYTYIDPATGVNTHVDSDKLRQWCADNTAKLEVVLTPVDPNIACTFLDDNVIDLAHLARVKSMKRLDPIIYCVTEIGANGYPNVLLVDGHHRFFLAYLDRRQLIESYILTREQWVPFQIIGLPDLTENQLRAMPTKPRR